VPVQRTPAKSNVFDILDRILDKGVVIDAPLPVSVTPIEIVTIQARVVVASIATYPQYPDTIIQTSAASLRGDLLARKTVAPPRPDPGASPGRPTQ